MPKSNNSSNGKTRVFLGRPAWEKHIRDFKASGLSAPEYAKQHNINLTTFRNWITKLSREQRAVPAVKPTFVPVNLSMDSAAANASSTDKDGLHIRLPNGIECTFPPNHSPGLILPWIEYLRVLP